MDERRAKIGRQESPESPLRSLNNNNKHTIIGENEYKNLIHIKDKPD